MEKSLFFLNRGKECYLLTCYPSSCFLVAKPSLECRCGNVPFCATEYISFIMARGSQWQVSGSFGSSFWENSM